MDITNSRQKSKEKNIVIEQTRRRNEESMARKRAANVTSPTSGLSSPEGPLSPSAGAMDSLLEKLRAAKPQTRDQRDRRRRARLKDRHQDRIASGQKIPELADLTKPEDESPPASPDLLSPADSGAGPVDKEQEHLSEGEDVAGRAASLLQGLRGDGEPEGDVSNRDMGSIRVRRRRENNAEEERRNRRRRRTAATATTGINAEGGEQSPTIEEVPGEHEEEASSVRDSAGSEEKGGPPLTPVTTVSPPTPERGTETRPVEISD